MISERVKEKKHQGQGIENVVSEVVEGYKSVDYSKLTPLLIEAIKELKTELHEIKASISRFTLLVTEIQQCSKNKITVFKCFLRFIKPGLSPIAIKPKLKILLYLHPHRVFISSEIDYLGIVYSVCDIHNFAEV
jgi:hypothetical protein